MDRVRSGVYQSERGSCRLTEKATWSQGQQAKSPGLPLGIRTTEEREKFMFETLFATLAAKIAAAGIAVAVAATGSLAGTGNLPEPAQAAVSQALERVGINIPSGDNAGEEAVAALEAAEELAEEALEDVTDVTGGETDVTDVTDGETEESEETGEPNENAAFGQAVAADARDGGVDGQAISEMARARAAERKAAGQANRPSDAGSFPEGEVQDGGSRADAGLETARNTPAGSRVPASVPAGGGRPAGTRGR